MICVRRGRTFLLTKFDDPLPEAVDASSVTIGGELTAILQWTSRSIRGTLPVAAAVDDEVIVTLDATHELRGRLR